MAAPRIYGGLGHDPALTALKFSVAPPVLGPPPGMTAAEYTVVISQTYVADSTKPTDTEIAQGWRRYNERVYGVRYD